MFATNYMRIEPAYREALQAAGLARVDDVLNRNDGQIVAWSRTTDSVYYPGANGVGFYVKRYFYPTWKKRLRGTFRGTFFGRHRSEAERQSLNEMRAQGVTAVRPVAVGCRRVARFIAASFLITEEAPDTQNLTSFALDVHEGRRLVPPTMRRRLIERMAQSVRRMHDSGALHGRLFWRNVLIRFTPTQEPEWFLLDAAPPPRLERLSRAARCCANDLSHLAASAMPFTSRTDRLRFLMEYLGGERLDEQGRRQFHELGVAAQPWQKHERQRIRMSARFDAWRRELERLAPETAELQVHTGPEA